jgi:hypothetical protein
MLLTEKGDILVFYVDNQHGTIKQVYCQYVNDKLVVDNLVRPKVAMP